MIGKKAETCFYKAVHKKGPGLQIAHKQCPQQKSLQKSQQKSHQNLNKNYKKNPYENPIKNPNSTSFLNILIFFSKSFLLFWISIEFLLKF